MVWKAQKEVRKCLRLHCALRICLLLQKWTDFRSFSSPARPLPPFAIPRESEAHQHAFCIRRPLLLCLFHPTDWCAARRSLRRREGDGLINTHYLSLHMPFKCTFCVCARKRFYRFHKLFNWWMPLPTFFLGCSSTPPWTRPEWQSTERTFIEKSFSHHCRSRSGA